MSHPNAFSLEPTGAVERWNEGWAWTCLLEETQLPIIGSVVLFYRVALECAHRLFGDDIFESHLLPFVTMCPYDVLQPHFQAFLQFHFDDHGSKMLRFGIAFPALPFVACFPSCMYKPCPLLVGLMARTDSACAHVDSRHDKREYTAFDHFPFHNHSPQNSSPRPGGWLILEV